MWRAETKSKFVINFTYANRIMGEIWIFALLLTRAQQLQTHSHPYNHPQSPPTTHHRLTASKSPIGATTSLSLTHSDYDYCHVVCQDGNSNSMVMCPWSVGRQMGGMLFSTPSAAAVPSACGVRVWAKQKLSPWAKNLLLLLLLCICGLPFRCVYKTASTTLPLSTYSPGHCHTAKTEGKRVGETQEHRRVASWSSHQQPVDGRIVLFAQRCLSVCLVNICTFVLVCCGIQWVVESSVSRVKGDDRRMAKQLDPTFTHTERQDATSDTETRHQPTN